MGETESGANMLDLRDLLARYEELENKDDLYEEDEEAEFTTLQNLLGELKGYGGDEQWRGDWYPVTLIRDSYFERYAQELADDIGATDQEMQWPHTCIDWKQATRELQMDYSTVEYSGVTYWYR